MPTGFTFRGQDPLHVTLRLSDSATQRQRHINSSWEQVRIATRFGNHNKALVDPSIDLSQLLPARISILQSSHLSASKHRVAFAILQVWLTGD